MTDDTNHQRAAQIAMQALERHAPMRLAVRGLLHNIDMGRQFLPTESDARALRDMKADYLNRHIAELRAALAHIEAGDAPPASA